jgi:hypothetical protein
MTATKTKSLEKRSAEVAVASKNLVGVLTRYLGLDVSTAAALDRYRKEGHPDLEEALQAFESAVGDVASSDELAALRAVIERETADLNGAVQGLWSGFHDAGIHGLTRIQGALDACCTIWPGHAEHTHLENRIQVLRETTQERQGAIEQAIATLDVETATALKTELAMIGVDLSEAEVRLAQLEVDRSATYLKLPASRAEANRAATQEAHQRWQQAEKDLAAAEHDTNLGRFRSEALAKSHKAAQAQLEQAEARLAELRAAEEASRIAEVRRRVAASA